MGAQSAGRLLMRVASTNVMTTIQHSFINAAEILLGWIERRKAVGRFESDYVKNTSGATADRLGFGVVTALVPSYISGTALRTVGDSSGRKFCAVVHAPRS